jgi:hypothetical protein
MQRRIARAILYFRPRDVKRRGGGGPPEGRWRGNTAERISLMRRHVTARAPSITLLAQPQRRFASRSKRNGGRRPPMPPSPLRGAGKGGQTHAHQISERHAIDAVAADAVPHTPSSARVRDQQCARSLALLRRSALPSRARLSGSRMLLAAPGANDLRRADAHARSGRSAGEASLDRLHQRLGRPAAVLEHDPEKWNPVFRKACPRA